MNVQNRINEVYEKAFPVVAEAIAQGEELPPGFILIFSDGTYQGSDLSPIPHNQWGAFQAFTLQRDDVAAIGIVHEGWAVRANAAEELDLSIRPSEHPNRIEGVCFMFTTKEGQQAFSMCEIERPANTLKKEPLRFMGEGDSLSGRMVPQRVAA